MADQQVVSILTRQTRLEERAVWEAALETVIPRIREVLESSPGFVSVEYMWSADRPGRFAQLTTWASEEDCRRYIREGNAATVAIIEETGVPTAAYPNGNWVRHNFSRHE
jgi:heme-degrading monooxygenase HmoA